MPKRTDNNQTEIVNAFRRLGCFVHVTSDLGKGFPDLLVTAKAKLWLIEIKDGKKPPSQRRLTPAEKKFHQIWGEHVKIISSVQDVISFVNQ
jgi:hypothetical protein